MKNKTISIAIGVLLGLAILIQFEKIVLFSIGLLLTIVVLGALFAMKKINKYDFFAGLLGFFTVVIILLFYLVPSYAISSSQGTVLTDNWWQSLNWIKNNTAECSVVATYWDPGHFITGIAERAVVFDGAGQNDVFTRPTNETSEGLVLDNYDKGIVQVRVFNNNTVTTARIKDIAITLFTDNETLAYNILKEYKKKGCNDVYYIASADLVYKSQWWTYFSTWDPLKNDPKGTTYNYFPAQLTRRKPLFSQSTVGYEYQLSEGQSFILYDENNTLHALLQQNNQFVKISKVVYPTKFGYVTSEDPSAEIKGTIYVPDSSLSVIFFFPKELENSMFTRMFFYNGAGLEHFEFVDQWGGEVKLFKLKINETS
ncbi:MAG: hypothetical protein HY831_01420 [Candidatus Aenigmarchaeota archaeon]|nr:hypothetical protein [Candidatus Aenigmarchaeota archaeon]